MSRGRSSPIAPHLMHEHVHRETRIIAGEHGLAIRRKRDNGRGLRVHVDVEAETWPRTDDPSSTSSTASRSGRDEKAYRAWPGPPRDPVVQHRNQHHNMAQPLMKVCERHKMNFRSVPYLGGPDNSLSGWPKATGVVVDSHFIWR